MGKEQPKDQPLDILALNRAPLPVSPFDDIAEGPGFHVQIGEGAVQVFPIARTARAELGGDRARVTHLTQLTVDDGALSLYGETDEYHTALRLDARSLTLVTSRKAAETSPQGSAVDAEVASDEPERPAAEGLSEGPGGEERARVTLVGRIGYKPRFRETARGTLVGQFALAVHDAPGETSWHSVVLFGARAEKLREGGLGKGDEVEVVGYPHEREKRNQKTGETRMVTEIYAAVVKRPKDSEQQKPPSTEAEGGSDA
jgi:hypothetical protein